MTLVVQRETLANQGIAQYVLVTLLFCATRLEAICATWRGLKPDECLTCIMMLLICLLFSTSFKELKARYDERKEEAQALDEKNVPIDTQNDLVNTHQLQLLKDTQRLGLDLEIMEDYKKMLFDVHKETKEALGDAAYKCKNGHNGANYLLRFENIKEHLEIQLYSEFFSVFAFGDSEALDFYNCMIKNTNDEALKFIELEMRVLRLTE